MDPYVVYKWLERILRADLSFVIGYNSSYIRAYATCQLTQTGIYLAKLPSSKLQAVLLIV